MGENRFLRVNGCHRPDSWDELQQAGQGEHYPDQKNGRRNPAPINPLFIASFLLGHLNRFHGTI
jgi:hypothetical protein